MKYHLNSQNKFVRCEAKKLSSCHYSSGIHLTTEQRNRVIKGNPKTAEEYFAFAAINAVQPVNETTKLPRNELETSLSALKNTSFDYTGPKNIAGHAMALFVEQKVEERLRNDLRGFSTLSQSEFLNTLYLNNEEEVNKSSLIGSIARQHLLNRGPVQISEWSSKNLFNVRQNDTADLVIFAPEHDMKTTFLTLADVKSRRADKTSQPPNIISARKLSETMFRVSTDKRIDDVEDFSILYIDVPWTESHGRISLQEPKVVELFKSPPQKLYINHAAGQQIQVDLKTLPQTYSKGLRSWAKEFIDHYLESRDQVIAREQENQRRIRAIASSIRESE